MPGSSRIPTPPGPLAATLGTPGLSVSIKQTSSPQQISRVYFRFLVSVLAHKHSHHLACAYLEFS
jgi:hypothetical protein